MTARTSAAHFDLPADWTTKQSDALVRATAPEGDLSMWLANVGPQADAAAATLAAWRLADPSFDRKPKIAAKVSPIEGWDDGAYTQYEVSPNEKLLLFAVARRHAGVWSVIMVRGSQATADKRSAALHAASDTWRANDFVAENYAGKPAAPLDRARREAMKQFWRAAMEADGVPGLAYAFFDRSGVVEEGGIGVRTVGRPEPVDAHTRFMIASNTKGMTTLLLARLVDEKKLGWDEPVVAADPAFRLGDPAVQRDIKIRNLVCACTGMPRQDMEWIMTGDMHTPAERVFALLAPMKPTTKFGEVYQYSNLLASAAGYVAGHVLYPRMEVGAAYDRAMQEKIFTPLGMRDTTFDKDVAVAADHADPHDLDRNGAIALGTVDKSDSIYFARPAGGAWSSAHDMALYALSELREGQLPSGERLVSRDAILARRNEGMSIGENSFYGMGLETTSRWGVKIIHHGGSMPGYRTDWMVLPNAGVGVVLLMNGETATPILELTRRRLVELLYGGRPQAETQVQVGATAMRAQLAQEVKRWETPADPTRVARLADHYLTPALGHIDVRRTDKGVVFDFGSFSSGMVTRKNEDGSVSFVMSDPTVSGWELVVKPLAGAHDALIMRDEQHEYVYAPQE